VYRRPAGLRLRLQLAPVLESWNARDHPDQRRLATYLDEVETALDLAADAAHMALELQVGLPNTKALTSGGGDLDNYLYPIARRLGAARLDAVFGAKSHASSSALVVGTSDLMPSVPPPDMEVRTTASASSKAWKEQVRTACVAAAPRNPIAGAIRLDLEFHLSPARNWTTLWKPAIDSLGPLLGEPDPRRPFMPNDDRIVQLGLHRSIDESMGWDIGISVWWAAAEG
jgi:hypothetical protein